MATAPATTTAAPAPAPGPELQLGKPKEGLVRLSDELLNKINAAAGVTPTAPEPAPAPEKTSSPAAQSDAPKPGVRSTPPPAPPAAEPSEPKAKEKDPKEGVSTPKQLREAFERASAKVAELEGSLTSTAKEKADAYTKLAEIESKWKSAEERIAKEYAPQVARLSELEKRLQEKEEAIRIRDYTASDEWHEKFEKPIAEINNEAQMLLSELRANVDGQEVPATQEHFNYVLSAQSLNEAARRAKDLFGDFAAPQIVNLRTRIASLQRKRTDALKNAQVESAEYFKRAQAEQLSRIERFKQAVQEREKGYLTEFQPPEGDTDLSQAISEGMRLADLATQGAPELTPEQYADNVAKARTRIAKSFVQEKQIARLKNDLKLAQDRLALYESSEPDVSTRKSPNAPAVNSDESPWDAMKERAVKMARQVG